MDKISSQINLQYSRAWIENGVVYHEYQDELTLTAVLEAEKKSIALLMENGMHMAPVIICLKDINKNGFKLTMADYGRVLSTFDLAKHTSGIWIVGVAEEVRETIMTILHYFEVNHIYFAKTIEEAQEAARSFSSSSLTILEKEH